MKLIQCGLGAMGAEWIRKIQAEPAFTQAAFVEPDAATAAARAKQFALDPALIFPSLSEALARVTADGIIDVTPPAVHREIAFTAFDAGLPVLAEKPLASTRGDAEAIRRRSAETGVLYAVAQNYRYTPVAQTVRRALADGAIGSVEAVSVQFFRELPMTGFRAVMPHPLIVDMAIHHVDLMRFFLDANPITVMARSWNPSWSWYQGDASAAFTLTFAGGAVVNYVGSWCSRGPETRWNGEWRFEGSDGVLLLTEDTVRVQKGRHGEPQTLPLVAMPHETQAYLLHEFAAAAVGGSAPATHVEDNIHTVGVIFDIVDACDTGAIIQRITP